MSAAATSSPRRAPIKVLLDAEDDITVVGKAVNGAEAVERARVTHPDVVLMGLSCCDLGGNGR
jgi:DNA-binding NarL/FixJ family response regulator